MVDPWTYRDKLTMPKMIVNGANDPYWSLDALNLYWDDLKGDKYVLYVPNAGHDLNQDLGGGKKSRDRAGATLGAFGRAAAAGDKMPALSWKHADTDGVPTLTVTSDIAPKGARLWVADAPTRDFRPAKWAERAAKVEKGKVTTAFEKPAAGYRAAFGELEFESNGETYSLSTQVRIVGAAK